MKKQKCKGEPCDRPSKKKKLKQERENGITLIALVITVIVLLILAGVALKLIAGGDGILGKAEKAVDTHNLASAKEELELLVQEARMEYFTNYSENNQKTFFECLQNVIQDKENVTVIQDEEGKITGNYKGYDFYLDDDLMPHIEEKSNITLNINVLTEGYVTSETGIEVQVIASSVEGEVTLQHQENEAITIVQEENSANKKYKITKNGSYTFTATDGKSTKTKTVTINSIIEAPQLEIKDNNTGTSFTVNVKNKYANELTFVYYLNGTKQAEKTEKTQNFSDLSLDTSYTVKVAIKYNGTETLFSEITAKTPAKPGWPNIILYKSNGEKIKKYQILTAQGITERTELETGENVTLELEKTSSIMKQYYSLDGGSTWNEYTDKLSIQYPGDGKIKAKQVNTTNNLESGIRAYRVENSELNINAYDEDETTGVNDFTAYLTVDEEMRGKKIHVKCKYTNYHEWCWFGISAHNKLGESEVLVEQQGRDVDFIIPEDCEIMSVWTQANCYIYDIRPIAE